MHKSRPAEWEVLDLGDPQFGSPHSSQDHFSVPYLEQRSFRSAHNSHESSSTFRVLQPSLLKLRRREWDLRALQHIKSTGYQQKRCNGSIHTPFSQPTSFVVYKPQIPGPSEESECSVAYLLRLYTRPGLHFLNSAGIFSILCISKPQGRGR